MNNDHCIRPSLMSTRVPGNSEFGRRPVRTPHAVSHTEAESTGFVTEKVPSSEPHQQYDEEGNLREVPLCPYPSGVTEQLAIKKRVAQSPTEATPETSDADQERAKPSEFSMLGGNPVAKKTPKGRYDVSTPDGMLDRREHYVAVVSTLENRHPDEESILEHYAQQYVAKKGGTYNPIEDPPVDLSDLVPTVCVVINRIFREDEALSDGSSKVKAYVEQLAKKTDMDVVPVICGRPFHLPLHALCTFKYKDEAIDQIMNLSLIHI